MVSKCSGNSSSNSKSSSSGDSGSNSSSNTMSSSLLLASGKKRIQAVTIITSVSMQKQVISMSRNAMSLGSIKKACLKNYENHQ